MEKGVCGWKSLAEDWMTRPYRFVVGAVVLVLVLVVEGAELAIVAADADATEDALGDKVAENLLVTDPPPPTPLLLLVLLLLLLLLLLLIWSALPVAVLTVFEGNGERLLGEGEGEGEGRSNPSCCALEIVAAYLVAAPAERIDLTPLLSLLLLPPFV